MKRIFSILLVFAMCVGMLPVYAAEEPIINNDFENGEVGFGARGTAAVELSKEVAYSGSNSMLLTGRGSNAWEGAGVSIANGVKLDETYYGQMYVKAADEGASFTVKMSLELTDDTKTDYPQMGAAKVNGTSWTLVEGTWTADYTGNLKTLNFNIETDDAGTGKAFYVDNVFFAHESVSVPKVTQTEPVVKKENISYSGNKIAEDILDRDYKDIDKMMSLGVISGYPDGSFKPDNDVTRAEFLVMLMRMLKMDNLTASESKYTDVQDDHFARGAIEAATSLGICHGYGNGKFGPDDHVTYVQAVKMLMSTMGYAFIADEKGGYPNGYMAAAREEDIYVSENISMDDNLTRAMTAELLCNALDVGLYMQNGKGGIVRDNNRTILTEYYNGDLMRGYVEASNDASVNGDKAGYNSVKINGVEYFAGDTKAEELVGYYVDFICSEIDGEYTLLYIQPRGSKNDELVIDARDIDEYSNYEYTYYEGDKKRKAKLDKGFTIIYNGQTAGSYNDSMMIPELGSVKLIAADGGNYTVAYITSYETIIVSSINKITGDIYDIDNKKYTFEPADDNISYIKPDGSSGTIADISKDDVLHVASSDNNDKITVRIVRSTAKGKVNSVSNSDITIDDMKYDFSNVYKNRNSDNVNAGENVTAHLDINGDIVYIENNGDSNMKVGYIMNAFMHDNGEKLQIKYMTSKGSIEEADIANSITIDGVKYKNDINAKLNALRGSDGTESSDTIERIFRYNENSSGEIRKIDFARNQRTLITDADRNEEENTLYAVNDKYIADGAQTKYKYKYNARTFIDEGGSYSSIAFSPNTLVFIVPDESLNAGDEEYEVTNVSSIGYDAQYEVYGYKTDMKGIVVDYAVLIKNGTGSGYLRSQNGYVVTSVFYGLNKNEEDVPGFEVYIDGKEQSYILKNRDIYNSAVEANDGREIERGDIIRFDTDSSGEISNLVVDNGSGKYGDYFYSARGYIYFKDDGYAYFTTKRPTESMSYDDMILIPLDGFDITVYSKRYKDAYSGVEGDIIDYTTDPENYSSVYITMNYENAKTLICVTDD